MAKTPRFYIGQRVSYLRADGDREYGTIADDAFRPAEYIVRIDQKFLLSEADDGIRNVNPNHMKLEDK